MLSPSQVAQYAAAELAPIIAQPLTDELREHWRADRRFYEQNDAAAREAAQTYNKGEKSPVLKFFADRGITDFERIPLTSALTEVGYDLWLAVHKKQKYRIGKAPPGELFAFSKRGSQVLAYVHNSFGLSMAAAGQGPGRHVRLHHRDLALIRCWLFGEDPAVPVVLHHDSPRETVAYYADQFKKLRRKALDLDLAEAMEPRRELVVELPWPTAIPQQNPSQKELMDSEHHAQLDEGYDEHIGNSPPSSAEAADPCRGADRPTDVSTGTTGTTRPRPRAHPPQTGTPAARAPG